MNITAIEYKQFEECRKQGFVFLNWKEEIDDITGIHCHHAIINGSKITLRTIISHLEPEKEALPKKYEVLVNFHYVSDIGDAWYFSERHIEYEIEAAIKYAQWQATLILRLIEGNIETFFKM
jgi:hypothetical protein